MPDKIGHYKGGDHHGDDETLVGNDKGTGPESAEYSVLLGDLGFLLTNLQVSGYKPELDWGAAAVKVHSMALDIQIKLYGNDHVECAISNHNMGSALMASGKCQEALAMFEDADEIWGKTAGRGSKEHAETVFHIANLVRDLGDHPDLVPKLYGEVIAMREKACPTGAEYLETLMTVAAYKLEGNDLEGAVALYDKVLKVCEEQGIVDGTTFAAACAGRGRTKFVMKKHAEAVDDLEKCLKGLEASIGIDNIEYLSVMGHLATVHLELEDRAAAGAVFTKYVEVTDKIGKQPKFAEIHLHTFMDMVFFLAEGGEYGEAQKILDRALALTEAQYGSESQKYLATLNVKANLLADSGEKEKALACYRQAATLVEKVYGKDSNVIKHVKVIIEHVENDRPLPLVTSFEPKDEEGSGGGCIIS
eukprot:g4436.t1